ncbi:MAG: hypothetical protein ACI8RD_009111 [Bacillariaceae sp.]|jgi:hypothetical protein
MNNNNNNKISPATISLPLTARGWTKPERITEDIEPTKLLSETTTSEVALLSSSTSSRIDENLCGSCLVCKKNKARYSCPRCQTPYCSTECYRNHTTRVVATDSTENENNNIPSYSCTEVFFKKKVTSLMELESKEQENKTHQVLNRYHHNQRQHQELAWQTNTNDDYNDENDNDDDNEHDMYELLSKLEELEDGGDGDGNQLSSIELAKLLPPSIKAMFQRDMENGQIQELVLDRWYPWWRRELVNMDEKDNNNNSIEEDDDDDDNSGIIENENTICKTKKCHSKTLDERLLRVPDYCGLGKNKDGRMSNNNIDDVLLYNLIDILYATCWTLRLYHGVKNASRQAPVEAAITLIETSSVLSKDRRFTTLSQVLTNCTTGSSLKRNNNGQTALINNDKSVNDTTTHWTVFMEDIAFLVTSHRLVGRALLEASDILKAAIKELKDDDDDNDNSNNNINNNKSNERKGGKYDSNSKKLKQIRRLRKKLQFFLSWTQYPATVELFLGGNTNEEILAWMVERKTMISECQQDDDNDGDGNDDANNNNKTLNMDSFKVPSSVNTTYHQNRTKIYNNDNIISETKQPIMVEVQSRRK